MASAWLMARSVVRTAGVFNVMRLVPPTRSPRTSTAVSNGEQGAERPQRHGACTTYDREVYPLTWGGVLPLSALSTLTSRPSAVAVDHAAEPPCSSPRVPRRTRVRGARTCQRAHWSSARTIHRLFIALVQVVEHVAHAEGKATSRRSDP